MGWTRRAIAAGLGADGHGAVLNMASVAGLAPNPQVVTAAQTGPTKPTDPLVIDGRIQIQATPTAAADSDGAEQAVRDVRTALHALPDGAHWRDVKKLRDRTGMQMMKCKAALTEAGGDMEKAVEILRSAARG